MIFVRIICWRSPFQASSLVYHNHSAGQCGSSEKFRDFSTVTGHDCMIELRKILRVPFQEGPRRRRDRLVELYVAAFVHGVMHMGPRLDRNTDGSSFIIILVTWSMWLPSSGAAAKPSTCLAVGATIRYMVINHKCERALTAVIACDPPRLEFNPTSSNFENK
jgi:hypothetical protein